MKIYRKGVWICFWICIISFFIMLMSKFFHIIPTISILLPHVDKINDFLFNLSVGMFCSAFVVAITYISFYKIEKSKTIGLIKYFSSNYLLELSNLIPMLADFSHKNMTKINWDETIRTIKTNKEVNIIIKKLMSIHDERLINVEGFYPFLKQAKNNLEVHYLFCLLAKINGAVQYCDTAYKLENNSIYKQESEGFNYTDDKLKEQLRILLQADNDDYQKFFDIFKSILERNKPVSVYNTNWEEKCS